MPYSNSRKPEAESRRQPTPPLLPTKEKSITRTLLTPKQIPHSPAPTSQPQKEKSLPIKKFKSRLPPPSSPPHGWINTPPPPLPRTFIFCWSKRYTSFIHTWKLLCRRRMSQRRRYFSVEAASIPAGRVTNARRHSGPLPRWTPGSDENTTIQYPHETTSPPTNQIRSAEHHSSVPSVLRTREWWKFRSDGTTSIPTRQLSTTERDPIVLFGMGKRGWWEHC